MPRMAESSRARKSTATEQSFISLCVILRNARIGCAREVGETRQTFLPDFLQNWFYYGLTFAILSENKAVTF